MRVPNSGAYTGGSNASRKTLMTEGQIRHMKGDIVPPDDWKYLNCECKNYGKFPFHRFLLGLEIPLLEDWLDQILQAADPGDVNVLFFKITRVGKFVGFEATQPFITKHHIDYVDKKGNVWRLTEFDSFFKHNKDPFKKANTG